MADAVAVLDRHLQHVRELEAFARYGLASEPDGDERQHVQHVLQHSVGAQRAIERLIALRVRREQVAATSPR